MSEARRMRRKMKRMIEKQTKAFKQLVYSSKEETQNEINHVIGGEKFLKDYDNALSSYAQELIDKHETNPEHQ